MNNKYKKQWEQADSLTNKRLPQSAEKIVQNILNDAEDNNDQPDIIKAKLTLMSLENIHSETSLADNIRKAEDEAIKSSGVEKALWQSIAAGMYWQYYQNNRLQILERSTLENTVSDDIATWDAKAFVQKTSDLYLASISAGDIFKKIPVEKYLPLIIEGKNTRNLRPTLYDLLVFRAIDFFSNDEKDVTNPAYKFEIDNPIWFEDAVHFSEVRMKIADTNSLHFKALQLYQNIIAFHLNDSQPDALIDADLHRLQFVYDNAVSPDKDSLYVMALKRIAEKYDGNPLIAQADYLIATIQRKTKNSLNVYSSNIESLYNMPELKTDLENIRRKYPNTEGSYNSGLLLQTIEEKQVTIKTESVSLPDEYLKASIQYKNMDSIYIHLYRITANDIDDEDYNDSTQKPFREWALQLPGKQDFKTHSTEFKIDPLPVGFYVLIITDSSGIDDGNIDVENYFQVSNIAVVGIDNNDYDKSSLQYAVVNRKTGETMKNITADYGSFSEKKNQVKWESIYKIQTDNNGIISINYKRTEDLGDIERALFYDGKDSLFIDLDRNGRIADISKLDEPDEQEDEERYFIFTDRSIYRPGQKIYFKAIEVKSNYDKTNNRVVPNDSATVFFEDVNGQQIDSLKLVTNEYGSISGSFIAPETGLTGRMRIYIGKNSWENSISVNVEEYKRPKFYVEFDTLHSGYALGDTIKVTGRAMAYSGAAISDATVKFSVNRDADIPYLWQYYSRVRPYSSSSEIKSGTITTDENGKFELEFTAMPDKSIDKRIQPVFSFTVNADITDINGETRQGNTHISIGYTGWKIVADLSNVGLGKHTDSLNIVAQSLNGVNVPAKLNLKISYLKPLDRLYRSRSWDTLTDYIMSYDTFHKYFPDDEYKNEAHLFYRPVEKVILDKTFNTASNGILPIEHSLVATAGWYMFEIEGKDAKGNRVYDKQYRYVFPKSNDNIGFEMPFLITGNINTGQPGDKYDIEILTQHRDAALLMYHNDTLSVLKPNKINSLISQKDRGGISYNFCYVYHNRIYNGNYKISVPWSDKDLQIEWATHRDKLLPGAEDEWTMTIKGNKREKVAAELLAGMYDASLDAILPQHWDWDKLYAAKDDYTYWSGLGFDNTNEYDHYEKTMDTIAFEKSYDELNSFNRRFYSVKDIAYSTVTVKNLTGSAAGVQIRGNGSLSAKNKPLMVVDGEMVTDSAISPDNIEEVIILKDADATSLYGAKGANGAIIITTKNGSKKQEEAIIPRKNLQETAFFFPQLQTDSNGNVTFKFTMPEALTEWKLMAFAHTKDWKTGYLEGRIKTQKDLMVMPNLPRFFRQGDDMVITTKINSLADKDLSGIATLEILNAETMQPVDMPFHLQNKEQNFSVASHQSTTASWNIHIPESIYIPVVIRITARAGNFTDGEENILPVITNRMLVTETLPLPVRGNEEKIFTLDKLKNANSNTLVNRALTVEFTGNPAWYAVQSLPYLMEYPYECAEQTFNRFYANALAAHIVAQSPKVEAVFNQWKNEDTAALISSLSKNQELKSALLEETPWVMEAQNETEQKHRLAMLFETHQLAKELNKNLDKLEQMQLPEGGFPWFSGMRSDRYITQYIITGLARLRHLGVSFADKKAAQKIIDKTIPYLDKALKSDYDNLVKYKAKLDEQHIGYEQIQYLYMRSFYNNVAMDKASQKAFDYYKNQATKYWSNFNPYMQGMLALALEKLKDGKTAGNIMASLKETAVHNEEMGMYWKNIPQGYWWYQAPVEAQALLIEAFGEVTKDETAVDEMKTWLLKQKQTQNWQTTKATADACYALLLTGSDWLANEPVVTINLGDVKTIHSSDIKTEAGTGYFRQTIDGKDIQPAMGTIKVKVQNNNLKSHVSNLTSQVSWGAVYWQYFEDLDKITAAATPLSVTKELFIERNSDSGPVLTAIKAGNQLKVGDKVKVRIVLKADRDMEYVHLKDMRGACFEPVDVLSGYKYQNGLGYYESTKDVSTNFFFDHVNKGTYVLEYTVFVSQKGDFSNGIATAQCMYAPEFSSHSTGIRLKVE